MRLPNTRSAYTLLEVVLTLALAVLVLAALYSTIGFQLRFAQTGREIVEHETLVRSLCNRFSADIRTTVALNDPGRYRKQAADATAAASGTGATTGTNTGTGTGTGTTTTTADTTDTTQQAQMTPVELPLGVVGDSTSLMLFITRVPGEPYGSKTEESSRVSSDMRRISYWLSEGLGLCRREITPVTADEALDDSYPSDEENYLLASEVQTLEFSYFDGTNWVESWDSMAAGDDGVTPIGSPRAIAIRIGLPKPGRDNGELVYYRHVVAITTANGSTQSLEAGATTP